MRSSLHLQPSPRLASLAAAALGLILTGCSGSDSNTDPGWSADGGNGDEQTGGSGGKQTGGSGGEQTGGSGGKHVGDNEVSGVVVDPALPTPAGILAVRAISHQSTACEANTTCGALNGCNPCATAQRNGAAFPVVFSSVTKHGSYVDEGACDRNFICDPGGCGFAPTADDPPLLNAGEPGSPLITNLTTEGFINGAHGWSEQELMNFNPWGGGEFGGAGKVSEDLVDMAFVISLSGC